MAVAVIGDKPADWPRGVALDGLGAFLLGEEISTGLTRMVYGCRIRPDCVVKVELATWRRQNFAEWMLWTVIKQAATDLAARSQAGKKFRQALRWLAPVEDFSDYGTFLLMRRTTPPRPKDFPPRVPSWLFDLKRENFGMLDGRLVCHDYGTVASVLLNNTVATLAGGTKRADWYSESG